MLVVPVEDTKVDPVEAVGDLGEDPVVVLVM